MVLMLPHLSACVIHVVIHFMLTVSAQHSVQITTAMCCCLYVVVLLPLV
jgi:hypothetical protein